MGSCGSKEATTAAVVQKPLQQQPQQPVNNNNPVTDVSTVEHSAVVPEQQQPVEPMRPDEQTAPPNPVSHEFVNAVSWSRESFVRSFSMTGDRLAAL